MIALFSIEYPILRDISLPHGVHEKVIDWFVDGKVMRRGWANLCPACYYGNVLGLGWGEGQLYRKDSNEQWVLVAGGDPDELLGKEGEEE
jgi:hypothetical protein